MLLPPMLPPGNNQGRNGAGREGTGRGLGFVGFICLQE